MCVSCAEVVVWATPNPTLSHVLVLTFCPFCMLCEALLCYSMYLCLTGCLACRPAALSRVALFDSNAGLHTKRNRWQLATSSWKAGAEYA